MWSYDFVHEPMVDGPEFPAAKVMRWRQFYNQQRPHSAHCYKTPASVRRTWHEPDTITTGLTA